MAEHQEENRASTQSRVNQVQELQAWTVINMFKKTGAKMGTFTVKREHITKDPGRKE